MQQLDYVGSYSAFELSGMELLAKEHFFLTGIKINDFSIPMFNLRTLLPVQF